jgi:hypothetical protein
MRKIYMYPLQLKREGDSPNLYRGRFTAPHAGDLFLFVNDAVLPFSSNWARGYDLDYFYKRSGTGAAAGNHGTACVIIARADANSSDTQVGVDSPICRRAADAVRRSEAVKAQAAMRPPYLLP